MNYIALRAYPVRIGSPLDSAPPLGMEVYITGTGQRLWAHNKERCGGEHCCIHNPSPGPMRDWPTHWREDRALMERLCPKHGVGHPDPDDIAFKRAKYGEEAAKAEAVHGCCGCCAAERRSTL